MVRLAILGALSSHADAFCRFASERDDVELVGVFGEDLLRTAYLCETFGIERKSPAELADQCDVAAILFRSGDKHLKYAEPFIRKRIPVFIDKPFTKTTGDAAALIDLLRSYDCPFLGGSCVKLSDEILYLRKKIAAEPVLHSGYCAFPIQFNSTSDGFHFYSHHLIETMLHLFGLGVRSVIAKRSGHLLSAIAVYDTFHVVMNFAVQDGQYVAGYFGESNFELVPFNIETAGKRQFEELICFAKDKKIVYSAEFFMETVKISTALELSMVQNTEIFLQ